MIRGKMIFLRAIEEEDLGDLLEWVNDPEISQLVGGFSYPLSMAQQKEWYLSSQANPHTQRWIVSSMEGKRLGLTGLWDIDLHNRHALTAVKLGSAESRGRGFGTDTIMTVMAYAFQEVGLNRLYTEILHHNVASYKAYVEKCGWKVEGIFRKHVFRNGIFYDQLRIAILRDEFLELPASRDYIRGPSDFLIKIKPEHKTST